MSLATTLEIGPNLGELLGFVVGVVAVLGICWILFKS